MKKKIIIRTLRSLLVLSLLSLWTSCSSIRLPPRLTETQSRRLSELPLHYSVGVAPYERRVYSESLTVALKASGVFAKVEPLDHFTQPPDYIAKVEKEIHGTPVIPFFTFISLGLVPTMAEEDHGYVFSLTSSSQKRTMVDASYSGTSTLGLASIAFLATSNYTSSVPEQSKRYRQFLASRTLSALK